jgi:hypothetical protein
MQLQKRALRLDKILLGYQGHHSNEETVINPKDKYTIKSWENIGKSSVSEFVCSLSLSLSLSLSVCVYVYCSTFVPNFSSGSMRLG